MGIEHELGMKKENVIVIYLKMESLLQLLVMSGSDQRMGGIDESAYSCSTYSGKLLTKNENKALNPLLILIN